MNETVNPESAFAKCNVQFLQKVITPVGEGLVQGILKEKNGVLKVIVSHTKFTVPGETIPKGSFWSLRYYEPGDVSPA